MTPSASNLQKHPVKKILIAGYFGFYNTGDEAILSAMLSTLRKSVPGLKVCVVSGDPQQTESAHKVNAVHWQDESTIIDRAVESDLILLGGGGIFHDYWGVDPDTVLTNQHAGISYCYEFSYLAEMLQKPFVIHSVGVGPVTTPAGVELTRMTFDRASISSVRDRMSKKILADLGCKKRIGITTDPGFCIQPDRPAARKILKKMIPGNGLPLVIVNVRNWDIDCNQGKWQTALAAGLDKLQDKYPCNLLFLPFHRLPTYPLTDDPAASKAVISLMSQHGNVCICEDELSPEVAAGLIAESELLIGMRLHSVIFAAISGIPVIAPIYDPKVSQLMDDLEMSDFALDLSNMDSDLLCSLATKALCKKDKINQNLVERTSKLRQNAQSGLHRISEFFDDDKVQNPSGLVAKETARLNLKQTGLLSEKAEQLYNSKLEINQLQHTLNEYKRMIEERNREILSIKNQLTNITQSRGWKYLLLLWKMRLSIIPRGSRRERFGKSVYAGIKSILKIRKFFSTIFTPKIFIDAYTEQDNSIVTLYTDKPEICPEYIFRKYLMSEKQDLLKVSLIATIKNEIGNVGQWLNDIRSQTRLPDEIIIVDGGSKDGSFDLLEEMKKSFLIPINLILGENLNRSEARNLAVKATSHPIIAVTDFGCSIQQDWLKRLVQPFIHEPETCVSAGFYQCLPGERNLSNNDRYWASTKKMQPQTFLPSSRSVAFTRRVIDAVGGHPEWLAIAGDDTYLDLELKRQGGKWGVVPEAIVHWQAPLNLPAFVGKNYQWATGDGESGVHAKYYLRSLRRLVSWSVITLVDFALICLFFALPVNLAWLWATLAGITYLVLVWLVARRAGLGLSLAVQKVLGEAAQVSGFIHGASRRKEVSLRRFAIAKGVIFVLAGVPINDTGGGSRSAQIAGELLMQGYVVVYINKFPRHEAKDLGLQFAHPNLLTFSLKDFNWDKLIKKYPGILTGKKLGAIVEFPLEEFHPLIQKIKSKKGRILYDLMDDWETSLGGTWFSSESEKKIASEGDVLAAATAGLRKKLYKLTNRAVALLPNAVNDHIFNPTRNFERPLDIPGYGKIITYIGALWGEWFDWDLLFQAARENPAVTFCVIGDYRGQAVDHPANLQFLGLKPQSELPAYLACTDVAIIPWKRCRITDATSPLKLYEYLAMGCPVVAPDLPQLRNIPGVFLAKDQHDFVRLVDSVDRKDLSANEVKEFISQNNWECRVKELLKLMRFSA